MRKFSRLNSRPIGQVSWTGIFIYMWGHRNKNNTVQYLHSMTKMIVSPLLKPENKKQINKKKITFENVLDCSLLKLRVWENYIHHLIAVHKGFLGRMKYSLLIITRKKKSPLWREESIDSFGLPIFPFIQKPGRWVFFFGSEEKTNEIWH